MILADKIIDLRKKNGWSQEELAEMMDVSRQSISKWEGAQSVPDMNRIIRLSEIFGVSTDYLLKDEMDAPEYVDTPDTDSQLRSVSMEEATDFMAIKERTSGRIALGVAMCIASPILLIVMGGAQETGKIAMRESAAAGIGLLVLIALIGGAVALFLKASASLSDYEYMEEEALDTAYGIKGLVRERKAQFKGAYSRWLTIGIVLCVISSVPLFAAMAVFGENEFAGAISVGCILLLVAIGVFMIVQVSIVQGSYQMLLEEGDYTREAKAHRKKTGWISGVYWLAVVALFLLVGFLTDHWEYAGVIFAVAGVCYGILMTIISVLSRRAAR